MVGLVGKMEGGAHGRVTVPREGEAFCARVCVFVCACVCMYVCASISHLFFGRQGLPPDYRYFQKFG